MTNMNRLGTALTAVSLIAIATACAGPSSSGPRSASIFGGKVDTSNIGLATKAQMALASNDVAGAIPLAERAVERSPRDAGFRALLGNCYLAAGRFASAEAAYKDSLTLVATQPQIVLKLALVEIAQGKNDEAKYLLAQAQGMLDAADTGLALALAGDPQNAIAVLEPAARAIGADSRTRQNLALAYAFAGNWEQARTVAGQDVPGDQLDTRIQQWMVLAKPGRPSDQVAAFIGIQPAAGDPGQPIRLALNKNQAVQQAAAQPVAEPAPTGEAVAVAVAEPAPVVEPTPAPVTVAAAEPVAMPEPASSVTVPLPLLAAAAPISPIRQARPALSPAAVRLSDNVPMLRRAAAPLSRKGNSRAVVQLGAYSSRSSVAAAWSKVASKHGSLKRYTPVSARFVGAKGAVYRLSVRGFASDREAINVCVSLKRAGGSCFVRAVSGDAPVQFASR
jgi:D-alanyl-D-alanine carboxypeptidase